MKNFNMAKYVNKLHRELRLFEQKIHRIKEQIRFNNTQGFGQDHYKRSKKVAIKQKVAGDEKAKAAKCNKRSVQVSGKSEKGHKSP